MSEPATVACPRWAAVASARRYQFVIAGSAICLRGKERIPPPICRCRPARATYSALGFAGKTIGSAVLRESQANIILGIIPEYVDCRLPSAPPAFGRRVDSCNPPAATQASHSPWSR